MNANPQAIKVLCFGDSNTWGQKTDKTGRYPANVRWTGVLQNELGDNYYVIEEGLGSRTTDLDYDRKPGRNGIVYLQPCLESHNPLDVVIIMLGTNDLKIAYDRSAEDISIAIGKLIGTVKQYGKNSEEATPKILVVSPILVDDTAPWYKEFYSDHYDHQSAIKSTELAKHIKQVVESTGCAFVDAATVSKPGKDGIHFDEQSHPALGKLLAETVKNL
jgi:lysophospholipase L1-like esterase